MSVISAAPQTSKRLMKDIQNAQDPSIVEQGIWYVPDDTNMTMGHAMILGPQDTPYEGCLLVFRFQFPSDYPFSPPKVTFLTSDHKTRFHPNLYVEGKVCLSILNTYHGPTWSGTQSLTSVLLSILGLLDNNPLAHEPAYERGTLADIQHRSYANAVEYTMVKLMCETLRTFSKDSQYHLWFPFRDILLQKKAAITLSLAKKIKERANHAELAWHNLPYSMSVVSQWRRLAEENVWVEHTA
jgi:ubiquitin-protein ligase